MIKLRIYAYKQIAFEKSHSENIDPRGIITCDIVIGDGGILSKKVEMPLSLKNLEQEMAKAVMNIVYNPDLSEIVDAETDPIEIKIDRMEGDSIIIPSISSLPKNVRVVVKESITIQREDFNLNELNKFIALEIIKHRVH
jgi:hypothetical protein